jgi:hypothetical protein
MQGINLGVLAKWITDLLFDRSLVSTLAVEPTAHAAVTLSTLVKLVSTR